ncbi:MAG: transposase, partial [Thaumarchaeota archaeon]|nr:transposase [Nitrososphaerota archaeon]
QRHDSVDFVPLLKQSVRLAPVSTAVADRGYDSEYNHVSAQDIGIVNTIIRPKYENLSVYKTRGLHRKTMKRHFDWESYHQRSKVETIFSVIKRMLGEHIMSRYILTQNREAMYRIIAYNCYRINWNCLLILDGFYRATLMKFTINLCISQDVHVQFVCHVGRNSLRLFTISGD